MAKKVLIIETSLRNNSNSDKLADSFAKGAEDAGNEVEIVSLKGKRIGFCTGCFECLKRGHCVIDDDANAITEKILETDVKAAAGLQGWVDCFEKARFKGKVFAGGVNDRGDIENHKALKEAYELGKTI